MCIFFAKAQEDKNTPEITAQDTTYVDNYLPLKPAKVAFLSAVLPGLGQAYNRDYWKIPLVYGALGTGVVVAVYNNNEFQRYRTAYKNRIAGRPDEFTVTAEDGTITEIFTEDNLIDAQDFFRKRKELSILVTAGLYILQIIEANVDAHLSQYNVDDRLSVNPFIKREDYNFSNTFGFSITYSF
ncbi:MAG: DUF5683 domain-containing protein [Leeuwenhoekiella sp.]